MDEHQNPKVLEEKAAQPAKVEKAAEPQPETPDQQLHPGGGKLTPR